MFRPHTVIFRCYHVSIYAASVITIKYIVFQHPVTFFLHLIFVLLSINVKSAKIQYKHSAMNTKGGVDL
jgi:hypothetical protein